MSGSRDDEFTDYVVARLPSLRRLAMVLCQDWQRADDLVQAAITKLYVHWGRASAVEHVDAYARTVLVHEFMRDQRSGWARRVFLNGTQADRPATPVDQDTVLDLKAAVAALPPRQRATLVLRFYCDLNVDRSAELLGCSVGTVKSQTAKALAQLRRCLAAEPGASPTHSAAAGRGRRAYGKVSDHG